MDRTRRRSSPWIFLSLGIAGAAVAAADVEGDLRGRLRGRWGILQTPVSSECTDHYTDNEVAGRSASGGGPNSLPAGEVVSIDNVHLGWTRFDVNLSLLVPLRVAFVDGPFTLYERRSCRVQLSFDVGREVKKDARLAEAAVLQVLEVHDSAAAARDSARWNRREPEPLPDDAEERWAEYRAWKAQQVNVAVREKLDDVLGEAQTVAAAVDDDPEYLSSFAQGLESKRYWSPGDCDDILSASFYVSGSGGPDARGFADGQHLGWALAVARALQGCFVDPSGRT